MTSANAHFGRDGDRDSVRTTARRPLTVVLLVAVLAACGGGSKQAASTSTTSTTTTSTTTTTTAPTTTAAPTTTTLPGAGDAITTSKGTFTMHEFQNPAQPTHRMTLTADPGNHFAAVDFEVCATSSPASFSPLDLVVVDSANRRWETWNVQDYTNDPRLRSTTVSPGDCARGWVSFQVADDATPVAVLETDPSPPARWTLA